MTRTFDRCLLWQVQGHRPVNIRVLEAAKVFDNTENKLLMDTRKVTREPHDMLKNRLQDLLVHTKARELLLVDYVVSGPTLLTLFASCPGQVVTLLEPDHTTPEFKLTDLLCHFNMNLCIFKHLLVTKLMLSNSKAIIQVAPLIWDDDSEESSAGDDSSAAAEVELPPLQSTPAKKRGTRIVADSGLSL